MSESVDCVAAVVVLYNPPDHVFDEISSYIGQVSKVFVIDNSVQYNESLIQRLESLDKIVYLNNGGNLGIAAALNTGARLAMAEGFDYLLTMDQDTSLSPSFVQQLMTGLQINGLQKVGIMAPRYNDSPSRKAEKYQKVLFTMTSGNLLNLKVFKEVGPFLGELFIDHVDHEFGLRLNTRGYWVLQENSLQITHRPGSIYSTKLFFKTISFSSHSPLRLYYFCRNGVYVSKLYWNKVPSFPMFFLKLLAKEATKLLLFEKNKLVRTRMLIRGLTDGIQNQMGPFKLTTKVP